MHTYVCVRLCVRVSAIVSVCVKIKKLPKENLFLNL